MTLRILFMTHCLMLISTATSEITPTLPGDFHLGGLFKTFHSRNGQCTDEIDAMSVRIFEAVKWTLKTLNKANYIPGITLGIEAFPTCNAEGKAVEHTTNLMNRRMQELTNEKPPPIIGLIGPEYSHEAVDTSSYISSLGKNNLILQTLFSTTASALSDGSKFRNILRVIPDDTKQIAVIVSLMKTLEWNYIGVIYENNTYGVGNYNALQIQAKKNRICIASARAISVKNGLVDLNTMKSTIEAMISYPESTISGVIVFSSTGTAKVFLSSAQKLKDSYNFQLSIIFSEGTANMDVETLNLYDFSKGSFFTSPTILNFEEFKEHWGNILTNKTAFNEEVSTNPWLENVVKKFVSCDIHNTSCSMPTLSDINSINGNNVFEGYAIVSALFQMTILKNMQTQSCGSNGLCSKLNTTLRTQKYEILEQGRKVQLSMNTLPAAFKKQLKVTFDETPNAKINGNIPVYEVYQFRNCPQTCLERVATYNDTLFDIKLDDQAPDILKAQCAVGKKCVSCRNSDLANEIIFKKGDLYVGAIVPIYNKNITDLTKCADIRTSNGWEIAEGIRFAVETVNEKAGNFLNMFPGKRVGYIIFNSCNRPILIQTKLLKFLKDGLVLNDGSQVLNILKNILGFIGAYGSSTSQATSLILQAFNLPQISYSSTAAVLSERSTYEYFMRTCTPDDKQALAMLNIVKSLNSSYVQIMFSEGTYGEGGRDAIVKAARDVQICIANQMEVKENQYTKIIDDLNKTPYASVVLLFLKSHVVDDVLTIVQEKMTPGAFLFIGSEAFGTRMDIISGKTKLEGTITLSLQMKPLTGTSKFEKYLYDRLTDYHNDINPWTKEYFEQRNSCFLSGSFNKMSGSKCPDIKEPFNNKDYQPELWTAFAINAMFSLLQGANKSFAELCGTQSSALCQQYRDSPQKVYDMIKNEKLVIDDSGIPSRVFNENGDGNIGYKIYQVQRKHEDASQLAFVEIGRYTLDENGYSVYHKLIRDPFKSLPSKCPNFHECSKCSTQYSTTSPSIVYSASEVSSSTPVAALGALLGLSLLALGIVSFLFFKMYRKTKEEDDDPYLQPRFSASFDMQHYSGYSSSSVDTDIPNLPKSRENQQSELTDTIDQTNNY